MKKTAGFLLLLILANTTLLTGCWNYREINNLVIVAGFAIDKKPAGDGYHITVEVVDFESGGEGSKVISKLIESDGETVFDAVRSTLNVSGRRLYWSHAKIAIFSQEVAQEGLAKVLDLLFRDAEIREDLYLLISKENSAKKILESKPLAADILSFELKEIIDSERSLGEAPKTKASEFLGHLAGKEAEGIIPMVGTAVVGNVTTPTLMGTAVLKDGRLVGFLDSQETKYLLFVNNDFEKGLLVQRENSNGQEEKLTLEVYETKTKRTPKMENGQLRMEVQIKVDASIGELETSTNYMDKQGLAKLKQDAAAALEAHIQEVVKKTQVDLDTDVFNFNQNIQVEYPEVWKELENNWDEAFRNLPVDIVAEFQIRNSALTTKPIKAGE